MRRRIKRKVFMVGMAVSATLPISASAKASGKPDYESHPYSNWRTTQLTIPGNDADAGDIRNISLIGKLKNLLGGAGYVEASESPYSQSRGWQVELLQNHSDQAGDIRQARDKRFGLAFRLSF